jgi:light-regulated signal transduction histidine kinase (bacteriophytochrome)
MESFDEMLGEIQQRDSALQKAHDELEERVSDRTRELVTSNQELEAFSYSVSHDLRAPLRSIDGFSQVLMEDYADKIDAQGIETLQRVRAATQKMSVLIDDMLNLSRVSRSEMNKEDFDLSAVSRSIAEQLQTSDPERNGEFVIENNLRVTGDPHLLRVALENLLGNAWKYTSRRDHARIEFGRCERHGQAVYFVRDNGAGFDPQYASRLFEAFQRLHSAAEFPGTGVGLATVDRIVRRHGGAIWAESAVEKGATFYFTLSTMPAGVQQVPNANESLAGVTAP